jgi:hypothetical protein
MAVEQKVQTIVTTRREYEVFIPHAGVVTAAQLSKDLQGVNPDATLIGAAEQDNGILLTFVHRSEETS